MFRSIKNVMLKMYYGGDYVAKMQRKGALDLRNYAEVANLIENIGTLLMLPLMNETNVKEEVWSEARREYCFSSIFQKLMIEPNLIRSPILNRFIQNMVIPRRHNQIIIQILSKKQTKYCNNFLRTNLKQHIPITPRHKALSMSNMSLSYCNFLRPLLVMLEVSQMGGMSLQMSFVTLWMDTTVPLMLK
jgi:hypothetical protein